MTPDPRAGVGLTDYVIACELLGHRPRLELSPIARAAEIPGWLIRPLLATAAARDKLRAWAARTPAPWVSPDAATILVRLAFVGDAELLARTADVLARLPPCVVDYVTQHVTFIGVGLALAGFCTAPVDCSSRPHLIVLSGTAPAAIEAVIAEEVAHAWLLEAPAPRTYAPSAFTWEIEMHAPVPLDLGGRVHHAVAAARRVADHDERLSANLIRAWGFA